MASLSRTSKLERVLAGGVAAAGSSAVDGLAGRSVDTSNAEGVMFIFNTNGASTGGTATFSVRQSTASVAAQTSGGQGTALTGASASVTATSSATAESAVIDIYKPRRTGTANFLIAQSAVASSCSVLGPTWAVTYGVRQIGNTTTADTVPQTTAASTVTSITGGVTFLASPST